jgi:carbonic anhydrase
MGHSHCGAVIATLEELTGAATNHSDNLRAIVDRVRPAIAPLLGDGKNALIPALIGPAVRANVLASASHLRHGSALLERLIERSGLVVVGAEYSLETGLVDFFDGVPGRAPAV